MGDFDACRFDFRLDAKNGLMPSKRKKTERIQPSNYSTLFKCKICGTLFSCRLLLLEHKLTHSEYRYNKCKYECGLCAADRRFSRKDQLRDHFIREHQLDDSKIDLLIGEKRPPRNSSTNRKTKAPFIRKGDSASTRKSELDKRMSETTKTEESIAEASSYPGNQVTTTIAGSTTLAGHRSSVLHFDAPQTLASPKDKPPPSYLYINFPILIAPPTAPSTNDSMERLLPSIPNEMTWLSSPSRQLDHCSASHVKVEMDDDVMTSQSRVTSPQTGSNFNLPAAVSRLLAYTNCSTAKPEVSDVTSERSNVATSGGGRSSPPLSLSFQVVKQDPGYSAEHGCPTEYLRTKNATTIGGFVRDEDVALDFSFKPKSSTSQGAHGKGNCTYQNDRVQENNRETTNAVDLSHKSRLSEEYRADRSGLPAAKRIIWNKESPEKDFGSEEDEGKTEDWKTVTMLPSNDITPPRKSFPKTLVASVGTETASLLTPLVHPNRKGKSGLSKMVEKLWKSKIGQMSEEKRRSPSSDAIKYARDDDLRLGAAATQRGRSEIVLESESQRWWKCSEEEEEARERRELKRANVVHQLSKFIYAKESQKLLLHQRNDYDDTTTDTTTASADKEAAEEDEEDKVIDLTTTSSGVLRKEDLLEFYSSFDGATTSLVDDASSNKFSSSVGNQSPTCELHNSPLGQVLYYPDQMKYQKEGVSLEASILGLATVLKCSLCELHCDNPSLLCSHLTAHHERGTGYISECEVMNGNAIDLSQVSIGDAAADSASVSKAADVNSSSSIPNYDAMNTSPKNHRLSCSYPQCGKTFKEWRHLKVHLTLHTGEKPLSCNLCKYTCRHRSSMNWHMKSRHRLEKSKTHGNRTVYVDVTSADGGCGANQSKDFAEEESAPERHPDKNSLLRQDKVSILNEEKEIAFVNELRQSLNFLKNGFQPEVLQQLKAIAGTGSSIAAVTHRPSGTTENETLACERNHCLPSNGNAEMRGLQAADANKLEASGPQLLLKKIIPAPGKDPQFYTSLMRMKYSKHTSKLRRQRQQVKRRHSAVNRGKGMLSHRCATCNHEFDCIEAVWTHGINEHNETPARLHCDRCEFLAESQGELQSHVLATHGKEMGELKDFLCSICGKGYSSKTGLNHHLQRHTDEALIQYICTVSNCGQKFSGKGALSYHIRLLHPGAKFGTGGDEGGTTLSCSEPEVGVSSPPPPPPTQQPQQPLLPQLDERPVTCDYPGCDKSFRELKHLKVHQMQHTDEKPLRCLICDYSCRQRNSMNWHMKSKHGQDKHVTSDGRTIYI